jgi:hypothetical protein
VSNYETCDPRIAGGFCRVVTPGSQEIESAMLLEETPTMAAIQLSATTKYLNFAGAIDEGSEHGPRIRLVPPLIGIEIHFPRCPGFEVFAVDVSRYTINVVLRRKEYAIC